MHDLPFGNPSMLGSCLSCTGCWASLAYPRGDGCKAGNNPGQSPEPLWGIHTLATWYIFGLWGRDPNDRDLRASDAVEIGMSNSSVLVSISTKHR